jgi:signal peptidase I
MPLLDPQELSPNQMKSHRTAVRLVIPLLVLLAAIVIPLYVLYDVSQVSGPSMEPTLLNKDYLLITRGWAHPRRGDVVVLTWVHGGTSEEILKRVVALGGDSISVSGDFVKVNGSPESFPHQVITGTESKPAFSAVVPTGTVFVLGDNRPISLDSRFIGPFPLSAIHGRVVAIWAPITRMRVIPSP